jgi:hypothetical protein
MDPRNEKKMNDVCMHYSIKAKIITQESITTIAYMYL